MNEFLQFFKDRLFFSKLFVLVVVLLSSINVSAQTVTSITRTATNPNNGPGATLTWDIVFSEAIVGLTDINFNLPITGSISLAGTPNVTGSGTNWSCSVGIIAITDGTVGLDFDDNTDLTPAIITLPVTGDVYTIDITAPTLSISAPSATDTNTGPLTFTVTYSGADAVTLANGNITLDKTGSADGSVNVTGSGTTTRTVTISAITGDGTLGISIAAATATDNATNSALAEGPSATFNVDNDPPTIATSTPSATDTNTGPIIYTVTYSGADAVTLANGNITLDKTGSADGSVNVSGSGLTARTVTISSITGNGTLGISIAGSTASDDAGNTTPADGPSTTFNVDNSPPTLAISAPSATDTNTGPITYTVTYTGADAVTLSNGDISLNGTPGASVAVTGSGTTTRTVTISSITGNGPLGISIAAGTASDNLGNMAAAEGPSTTFNVDNSPPTLAISSPSASDTNTGPITYTITYTGADAVTLSNGDISLNGSPSGSIAVTGSGTTTRTVTISSITGNGALGISIAGGTASDDAGNSALAEGPSSTFNVDNIAPNFSNGTVANASKNQITANFDSNITLSNQSGFTISGSSAGPIIGVTGSGSSILVFTLTSSVISGEPIALAYNGGGDARDQVSNALTNFSTGLTNNVAPLPVSAAVFDAAPADIVVVFDDAITLSDETGFSIDGISGANLNGGVTGSGTSTLTFTMGNKVASAGDILDFDYSGSGDGVNGNAISLASFLNLSIVNNVAVKPEPAAHVSPFTAVEASTTSINLSWTESIVPQLAENFLIVGRDVTLSGVFATPLDTNPVVDDSNWSNGNFAINVAVGSSPELISGLISGHNYQFRIYPYTNAGASINYKTDLTIPQQDVTLSTGALTTITNGSSIGSFSSLIDTKAEATIVNFEFDIDDDGATNGVDTAPTLINQIVINRDAADLLDWTEVIGGAIFEDNGTGTLNSTDNPAQVVITSSAITISGILNSNPTDLGYIADNSTKTYRLKIWLRSDISSAITIDKEELVFTIDQDDLTVEATTPLSSGIANSSETSSSSDNTMNVVATKLIWFDFPVSVSAAHFEFSVTVRAVDANNNIDIGVDNDDVYMHHTFTSSSDPEAEFESDGPSDEGNLNPLKATLQDGEFTATRMEFHKSGNYIVEARTPSWAGPYDLTAANTGIVSVSASDDESDIIATSFNPSDNIAYNLYQSSDISTISEGIKVGEFTIRDGGSDNTDVDAAGTDLNEITFDLSDFSNINQVALYDGSSIVESRAAAASVTFGSITSIGASDNMTATFSLYVSFNSSVTDNDNFQFEITNVDASGSTFAFSDGADGTGGAVTPLVLDDNRIEVTSTQLNFVQNASNVLLNSNMAPALTIEARDVNNNVDLDKDSEIISLTSTGTLTGTPITTTLLNGFGTLPAIQHTDKGTSLELTATLALHTSATSTQFDVTVSNETIIDATAFVPPSNILYKDYQEADINGDGAGDLKVGEFIISEGGLDLLDGDGVSTILTSIEFGVTNFENIRSIALYDQFGVELGEQPATATTTFNGLTYETPEGLSRTLQLFVSYKTLVDDNEQSIFTVTNATVSSKSSDIASFSSATPSTADINRIEVVASQLDFTTNPESSVFYGANLSSTPVIRASDANTNTDVDYSGPLTITNTAGLVMANGLDGDLNYSNGVITFDSNFNFTAGGVHGSNGTLTATDGMITDAISTAVTVNYSELSDIIEVAGFSHESDIDYTSYQEGSNIVNSSSSIVLERFQFRDGGATSPDADGTATVLTDITLQIGNWENLRRIELYNSAGTTALSSSGINEQVVIGEFVTFTGLNLSAPDDGNTDFTVRASFHGDDYPAPGLDDNLRDPGAVDDNEAITFTITNTIANPLSSQIEFSNGGGATSNLTANENRIEVTADRVIFTVDINTDPSTFSNISPSPVIKAKDIYFSTDVDHTGSVGNISTQNFNPSNPLSFELLGSSVTNLPGSFTAGVYDFAIEAPTLQYITDGLTGELLIAASGLTTGVSETHDVFASEESVLTHDAASTQMLIPYKDYVIAEDPAPYSLGELTIRDGGLDGVDADGGNTVLSDLTITVTNPANLANIALYDAGGTLIPGTVQTAPLSSPVTWSGLAITALDDGTEDFTIRSFFESTVTDNQPIDIQVLTVLEAGGSKFEFSDGADGTGGAQTTIGDNIIDVTADRLSFDATLFDSEQGINIPLTPAQPQVSAIDEVGNLDLDFSAAAVVTSTATISTVPLVFGNVTPGILDFPGFTFSGTGDGILTVNAAGVTGSTSNTIDVIHTTFSTLDLGATATSLNNGIEAPGSLKAGGTNKAILGFTIATTQNTLAEPNLDEIIVQFGADITNSLFNIRLVSSATENYSFISSSPISTDPSPGLDFATFNSINVDLETGTDLYYFIIADIDPTADFSTAHIVPTVIGNGTPNGFVANGDIKLSSGSIDANINGRDYGFDDDIDPVHVALNPANGNPNFPQGGLISIEFNEFVTAADGIITVHTLFPESEQSTLLGVPSADNKTFTFNPDTPITGSPLEGDVDYYITIPTGDGIVGFRDKSGNSHAGITKGEWVFKTSDNVAPYFTGDRSLGNPLLADTLQADAVNILDVGFDLRVALDEPGRIYYIVVDPNVTTGTPTVDEIRSEVLGIGPGFAGALVGDSTEIFQGHVSHYISVFDDGLFPTPGPKNFRVWMTGQDNSPTPNPMVDGDPTHPGVEQVDGTFIANPGGGVIIQNTPLNDAIDVCIGDPQFIFAPINIVEGANGDFNTGVGQTMNFILPPNFEYNTAAVTVTGQGPDISNISHNFINNTILTITYDITGTSGRDKLIIGGLEIEALGTPGVTGDIIRLGGDGAFPAIPDGTVLVSLNTIQAEPVTFITDPNTSAIGDVNTKVPLIADVTPLDQGILNFSGPGVFGDTLYVAASGLGSHTITLNYTSEFGCTSVSSINRTIFDSDKAIAGLDQVYNTNSDIVEVSVNGLDDFDLIGLGVSIAPEQSQDDDLGIFNELDPFLIDVHESLDTLANGNYNFKPNVFRIIENYNKYTTASETNDGGLIGELLFKAVYESEFDTDIRDTLEQTVKVYFSPTPEMSITNAFDNENIIEVGPFGDNTFDTGNTAESTVNDPTEFIRDLEFCEYETDIPLNGSSSEGYFAITIPYLNIFHSRVIPGLTDNEDGTGSLNLQKLVDNSVDSIGSTPIYFLFGEVRVSFTIIREESNDSTTVEQSIRVNATPVADFIFPDTDIICQETALLFKDNTGLAADDLAKVNSSSSTSYAQEHPIENWKWEFDDAKDLTEGEDSIVSHTFKDADLYNIKLSVSDDYGCAVNTTIEKVIGGLPDASFTFAGTSQNETFSFQSTSTVISSSPSLDHAIDSVKWDVDGDNVFDIGSFDNDPVNNNVDTLTYDGSNFGSSGVFDVKFVAISTTGCSDTLVQKLGVLPNEVIATSINTYDENFKDDDGGWIPLAELDANGDLLVDNSWEWGTSTAGDDAWVTGLNSSYESSERSYVYSPVFNLDSLDRPMIQFDYIKDLEDQDGIILEYSVDSLNVMDANKIWGALGTIDEGIEWFNAIGLAGSPGNDLTGVGWANNTEEPSEWLTAKHDLDEALGESSISFRVGLGAIDSEKNRDGFTFDNVFIGNRTRTVLIENFTSMAGGSENKDENDEINTLVNDPDGTEVVLITYHTSFNGEEILNNGNRADPSARALFYGISENPRVAIDGATNPDGNTSTNLEYSKWGKKYYSARTLQRAPFAISLTANSNSREQLDIEATLTATSDFITGDYTVHVVVVEDMITLSELGSDVTTLSGETVFNSTMRKMLPSASGTQFTGGLANGSSETINLTWNPTNVTELPSGSGSVDAGRLKVVVFIQDDTSHDILQASSVDVNEEIVLSVEDELTSDGVALYPNPADNQLTIELASKLNESSVAVIFDNTGRQIETMTLNPGQDRIELNTTNYQPGIYMFTISANNEAIIKRFIISHR